ncbi:MAG: Spy/CpxP family protein refolding chaperone [Desulfococcaceae bacterium]
MRLRKLVITTVVFAMIFGGAAMAAARGQGRGGNCAGKGMGGPGGMGMRFLQSLNLTDEQNTKVREILNSHLDEIKAKKQSVIDARQNMAQVIHGANPTEENVRAAHKTVAAAQEEATVLRVKIMNEVRQVLTDAQKAEMEKRRAEMTERMKTRFEHKWDRMEDWLDGSDA